jgi:hypothetical protein
MAQITASMLADLEPEIRAAAFYQLYKRSTLLPLVYVKQTGGTPGLTAEFPTLPSLVAQDVAETVETPETTIESATEDIRVSEKELNLPLTDMTQAAVGSDIVRTIGLLVGSAMARKLDQDIAAVFGDFTKVMGTAGADLTASVPTRAVSVLTANEAPGNFYGALHPFQVLAMKEQLTNAFGSGAMNPPSEMKANEVLYRNYLGTLGGAHMLETACIQADGNGDAYGAIFSPLAIGVNMKQAFELELERRGTQRTTHILGHGKWGVKAINPLFGVSMIGGCSEPA